MVSKLVVAGLTTALLATSAFSAPKRGGGGTTTSTLTAAQKDMLVFVYQEEKVARDTYITMGKKYPTQNTFASIQSSEQQHMDKARGLCETYKADISAINEANVGEFVLPVLQELYDTLVAQGNASELEALYVGEYIEILDIDDLTHAKEGMPTDVQNTYDNLIAGSYNHLDAFRNAIAKY